MDRKAELENLIKTEGLGNTAVNREYNQLTGVNTAAGDFFNSLKAPVAPTKAPATTIINQEKVINNQPSPTLKITPTPAPTPAPTQTIGVNTKTQEQFTAELNRQLQTGKIDQNTFDKAKIQLDKQFATSPTPSPTPSPTQKPTQPIDYKNITITDWKTQTGGGLNNLETLVENKYGTIATIQGNKLIAEINGEKFEWTIDREGNPIKKSLGKVEAVKPLGEEELFAQEKGIDYKKGADGKITYNPSDINQALDLYDKYGKNVSISKNSVSAIKGGAVYKMFSKYKGATTDEIFKGLSNGELAVGGEAWNIITRMNGGEETPAMTEARAKYDKQLKSDINKETNNTIYDVFEGKDTSVGSILTTFLEKKQELDNQYIEAQKSIMGEMANFWKEFQEGNEESKAEKLKMNELGGQINELEKDKRDVLKKLKEQYPGASIGTLLGLAKRETGNIDDELFDLRNAYSVAQSNYNMYTEENKAEFEYKMQMANFEMGFLKERYGTQRADLGQMQELATNMQLKEEDRDFQMQIRKEDIQRQDKLLADQLAQKEMEYQRAIAREDFKEAQKIKVEKEMLEYEQKLNLEFGKNIGGDTFVKLNPKTGELEYFSGSQLKGKNIPSTSSGPTISWEGLKRGDVKGTDLLFAPDGTKIKGKYQDGLECGEFVNDTIGVPGFQGNTIEDKLKVMDNVDKSKLNQSNLNVVEGRVGDVAVWRPSLSGEFMKYGHTGIIVGESEDGKSWLIKSANIKGDGTITTDEVRKEQIIGTSGKYNVADKLQTEQGQTQTTGLTFDKATSDYLDSVGADLNKIAKNFNITNQQAQQLYNTYQESIKQSEGYFAGIPLDTYNLIWTNIPTREKDAIDERKDLQEKMRVAFRNNPDAEPYQIALGLFGAPVYNLDDNSRDLFDALHSTIRENGIGEDDMDLFKGMYVEFAKGQPTRAISAVEKHILKNYVNQNPKEGMDEDIVIRIQNDLDAVIKSLEENKGNVGIAAGKVADFRKLFENMPEYQTLTTELTAYMADERRYFGGTAITPTEMESLKGFIGLDTKVQYDNLLTALKTLGVKNMRGYNSIRTGRNLPTITKEQLGNYTSRINGYYDIRDTLKSVNLDDIRAQTPTGGSNLRNKGLNIINNNLKFNINK